MDNKTRIFFKKEALPIGDVLGIVTTWEMDDKMYGELFFAKENDQQKSYKLRECTKIENSDFVDIENDLIYRMKDFHRIKNLYPESVKVECGEFNPYAEDRFQWNEVSEKNIYFFIDSYNLFFTQIKDITKNEKLKEIMSSAQKIKSMFIVEELD
jgi:hypothetical protein